MDPSREKAIVKVLMISSPQVTDFSKFLKLHIVKNELGSFFQII